MLNQMTCSSQNAGINTQYNKVAPNVFNMDLDVCCQYTLWMYNTDLCDWQESIN